MVARKVCQSCKAQNKLRAKRGAAPRAVYVCRCCARLVCEHFSNLRSKDGKTAVCVRCRVLDVPCLTDT